jgi:PKD repeat protein
VTHVYNSPGTYKVTLNVRDSKGLLNTGGPVEITIKEEKPVQPPLLTIHSFAVSPAQIPTGECAGFSWSFVGRVSKPGSGRPAKMIRGYGKPRYVAGARP